MTAPPARPHRDLLLRSVVLIGLITALPLPSSAADVADGASLEAQKAWVLAHAGRAVLLGDDLAVVFHPETNSAWLEADGTVLDSGTLVVMGDDPHLAIQWHSGQTQALPGTPPPADRISKSPSSLATAYDQLTRAPLAAAVPPLPPGTLFEPNGLLRLPTGEGEGRTEAVTASQADQARDVMGLWQPRGDLIALSLEGQAFTLSVPDLARATRPD